jgi:tetratricopeptide (TPR) repeat protein
MTHVALYLRRIHFERLSGQLIFKRGSLSKHLFFHDGQLVHAKTNVPEERLGEILFKLGKISDDAHEKMERYIEPNQALGRILTEKGVTSQRNVDDGLTYQLREIVLSLFPYFDGEFVFQEKPIQDQDRAVKVNIPYLVEDGIRRMKYGSELREFLAKQVPRAKANDYTQVLTEEEKQLLAKIKGDQTSEALWRSLKYNPEFYWKTLFLFYCLNIIDFRTEDAKKRAPEPKPAAPRPAAEPAPARPAAAPVPPPEPPAPLDLENQLQEVIDFREKLPALNYYQILNVPRTATDEEIKKAYFQLARRFHPDRFDRSISPNTRAQIEDIFDRITKAYRTLTSRDARREYDGKMPAGAEDKPKDVMGNAETKFRQARTLYNLGRYQDALGLLEEAVRLNRYKGGFYLLLAMSEAKIPEYRKKAEEHFLKAIELEPWNPEGFVGLGVLYKKEGLLTKATRMFQKAVELDGEHEAARRELASLTKDEKKTGLKGLLSKNLFGPKKK